MGSETPTMEKDNVSSTQQGDGPKVAEAKAELLKAITREQMNIPRDHPDWMTIENIKEDILRDSPSTLNAKFSCLIDILERLTVDTLTSETSK